MNHERVPGDACPLCRTPLRLEYGRTRPAAQLPYTGPRVDHGVAQRRL
ncbi:hypothetical protein [Streptomyces sp. DT203]